MLADIINAKGSISCNIEAEQAVLGVLLTQNRAFSHIAYLQAYDFYEPLHQRIFEAITNKLANGESVDHVLLKSIFDKDPSLCDIGGGAYLAKMAAMAVAVFDIGAYAQEIKRHSVIRAIRHVLKDAEYKLEDGEAHPHDIAATLSKQLASLIENGQQHRPMSDYNVALNIVESFKNNTRAISTGLSRLDLAMDGGIYPGKAYGFCAGQKVGKTILAGTISYNLAKNGYKHLFICGEMSPYEIHQRQIARELGVKPSDFRTRKDDLEFQGRIAEIALKSSRNILYQNAPGLTFAQLQMFVANAVNNHNISGFILDYWQLVGGKEKSQSSAEHLDAVAQWIANACRKYSVWAIVTAQINQDKGTTRGSQGLRLAFDQVYEIHREDRSDNDCWLEMMDTRYTGWNNIGSKSRPGLYLEEKGLYFDEV